jgi:hypothetical protein
VPDKSSIAPCLSVGNPDEWLETGDGGELAGLDDHEWFTGAKRSEIAREAMTWTAILHGDAPVSPYLSGQEIARYTNPTRSLTRKIARAVRRRRLYLTRGEIARYGGRRRRPPKRMAFRRRPSVRRRRYGGARRRSARAATSPGGSSSSEGRPSGRRLARRWAL